MIRPAATRAAGRLLGLAALALAMAAHGTPAAAMTLEEELSLLLKQHPQIQADRQEVNASNEEIRKSFSGYLPSVTLNADAGPEYIDSPVTRARNLNPDDFTRTRNVAGVTVTQNLFRGFGTQSAVKTARLNADIAGINLNATTQNTLFEGIGAFIDVLRQQELVRLAVRNEDTIQKQLHLEDERVQRGSGVAVDVLQAKSRLQISKERRVTFEGARIDAETRFEQVFGHSPNGETLADPLVPVDLLPATLDAAVSMALSQNPAVSNSQTTIEVARVQQKAARSDLFPSIDLVGAANYEKHKNAIVGTRRDYSVLLKATWNIFSGFSTKAGINQAAYNYHASKDRHEYVTRKIMEQTRLAWQAMVTARERVALLENAVNIATEVFNSRKKLREAGKETVINVLDAENEIYNAQINLTSARFDHKLAVYQLLLAMGRLDAERLGLTVADGTQPAAQ
ncbi:MAG: TolC family outer membrane protein [Hyphomicrobiales bacterium]|nr:TolC family outer membrane protein [Hyphomicrobiales bacterium]